ncbi:cyclic pyranopterin phosphate synthase [Pedobacter sp. UYP30]|uniref:GTP 3',8-cyclase MoaA n=1 Tax=Pedobacter sp. UYP30 TaxID=1756400 RepID=UPI00339A3EC9
MVIDDFGRSFKNLRISLLDVCNFACTYCTNEDLTSQQIKPNSLSVNDLLLTVQKLHAKLSLNSVRLTGGEPLLYPELEQLIAGLLEIGIPKVNMTSNGFLLEKKAIALRKAGLTEINISLDAAEEGSFFKMTRRAKLQEVKKGIDAAINAGLKVKLNAVLVRGENDDQVIPLLKYAASKNIAVRFLEVMQMGHLYKESDESLFSQQEILERISTVYSFKALPRKASATANYWRTECGLIFGIIANTSTPFCKDCDRLRLDHHGNIFGCLSVNQPINLNTSNSDADFTTLLNSALNQKQPVKFTGSELPMLKIGG